LIEQREAYFYEQITGKTGNLFKKKQKMLINMNFY